MELNQCEIALADMLERYRFKGTIDVSDEDMSRWICGGCSDTFFHAIALLVAKKFHAAGTTYLEADHCINALNWFYLEPAISHLCTRSGTYTWRLMLESTFEPKITQMIQ